MSGKKGCKHGDRQQWANGGKVCPKCLVWKPETEYYINRSRQCGRQSYCKTCSAVLKLPAIALDGLRLCPRCKHSYAPVGLKWCDGCRLRRAELRTARMAKKPPRLCRKDCCGSDAARKSQWCTECRSKYSERRAEFRKDAVWLEKHRAQCTQRERDRSPEEKARIRVGTNARNAERPEKYLYWSAKQRAKRCGVPFELRLIGIVIPNTCPVLGIPIFRSSGMASNNSPSLDRIIPSLGYTTLNTRVISYRANTIKQNATAEELVRVAQYVNGTTREFR